jgi:hypothetical protein
MVAIASKLKTLPGRRHQPSRSFFSNPHLSGDSSFSHARFTAASLLVAIDWLEKALLSLGDMEGCAHRRRRRAMIISHSPSRSSRFASAVAAALCGLLLFAPTLPAAPPASAPPAKSQRIPQLDRRALEEMLMEMLFAQYVLDGGNPQDVEGFIDFLIALQNGQPNSSRSKNSSPDGD